MNERTLQSLQGQVEALSLIITCQLQGLDRPQAAKLAENLATALREEQDLDMENETPSANADARDSIAGAYLDLLHAIAR